MECKTKLGDSLIATAPHPRKFHYGYGVDIYYPPVKVKTAKFSTRPILRLETGVYGASQLCATDEKFLSGCFLNLGFFPKREAERLLLMSHVGWLTLKFQLGVVGGQSRIIGRHPLIEGKYYE